MSQRKIDSGTLAIIGALIGGTTAGPGGAIVGFIAGKIIEDELKRGTQ